MCNVHWGRFQRRGTTEKRDRTLSAYTDANGYVVEYIGGKRQRQFQQRLVMERILGRPLAADETVHHRNGVRSDNRPENLELWVSSHPHGSRVGDLVAFAKDILARYDKE